MKQRQEDSPRTPVTVIMPIRNEASFIERSLVAVLAQDYPREQLEVIVVDGESTDGTPDVVRRLMDVHSNLTLANNPGRIVPTAMNIGIKMAHGDVIVRVDGHTIIAPDYVRQCILALRRSGADNVGGRMDARSSGNIGAAVAAATSSPFGVGGARFHYSDREEWVDTVFMGTWPKEVFERVGLFDEEMVRNQDDELNYRILDHGGKILLCPEIRSVYYNRSTLRSLWRQYFQYGYWKVRVMQKHPRQVRFRQLVPSIFVASLGLSALGGFIWSPLWIALGLILVVYLLGLLLAVALLARSTSWKLVLILPVVFFVLHSSYGTGFISGVLTPWLRQISATSNNRGKVLQERQ
jgi:succinoglycan biosynthesis protein ExoA